MSQPDPDRSRPALGREGQHDELSRPLSRREVLRLGVGGGLAMVATNAVTGVIAQRVATHDAETRAAVELEATRSQLETRIRRLEAELTIYRSLERVGIDHLIRALLDTYDRFWPPVRAAVAGLQRDVKTVEEALTRFEGGLGILRNVTKTLGEAFAALEGKLQGVQTVLSEVIRRTGPVGETVAGFLAWLLSKIPFGIGVGGNVKQANDSLTELVAGVPTLVGDARTQLLSPLQADWLATAGGEGIQGRLFDPLRQKVFAPLSAQLEQFVRMATAWENETAKPLRDALAQRQDLQRKLAQLDDVTPVA